VRFRLILTIALILILPAESRATIDERLLEEEAVRDFFQALMRAGGNGYRQVERGGFLRLLPDGTYEGQMWPFAPTVREAGFRGKIPSGTIAIAHTHPRDTPHPSTHDIAVAKRLSIPVVVLTPRWITVVEPDGTLRRIRHRR
jgi:hypothetical protein